MTLKKVHSAALSQPMILVYIIAAFCAAVSVKEPAFLSPATLINLCRAGIFTMCFAVCEMVVILAGGIDISFPAVGCVSMCVPMYLWENGIIPDNAAVFFLIAALCGLLFGVINSILVSHLHIKPLIATLATSSIASGGLILILGSKEYTVLPPSLTAIYNTNIFVYTDKASGFTYPLTVLILFPVILCIAVAVFLRYTLPGRGLYAAGGDSASATAAGFNVTKLCSFTYIFSGVITGITAMMYTTLLHSATTTALMGDEMLVIAACVVGGCSLKGGYGTVRGTVLGVLLITLIRNHLNMFGIPAIWQTFATGAVLLFGIFMTAIREKAASHGKAE